MMVKRHDLDRMKVNELKGICKRSGIKRYSGLRKMNMIKVISSHFASRRIQRWYVRKKLKREVCCITMEPVRCPFWGRTTKGGKRIYFNAKPMVDYLIATGKFECPLTRERFSMKEIKTLDAVAKTYKLSKRTLRHAFDHPEVYKSMKIKQEQIDILSDNVLKDTWTIRTRMELLEFMASPSDFTNIMKRDFQNILEILRQIFSRDPKSCLDTLDTIERVIQDIRCEIEEFDDIQSTFLRWTREAYRNFSKRMGV